MIFFTPKMVFPPAILIIISCLQNWDGSLIESLGYKVVAIVTYFPKVDAGIWLMTIYLLNAFLNTNIQCRPKKCHNNGVLHGFENPW
jgi:hypothetical protein